MGDINPPSSSSTDGNAIHDNVAAEISALSEIVLADGDSFIVEDLNAGTPNSKLKCLASALWTYISGKAGAVYAVLGANSDITSLAGLTTPLSEAQGGTGITGGSIHKPITAVFDGAGSALTTGAQKVYITATCAGTITSATLLLDQSSTTVIDVWKDTYANFPPTVADTITASAKPTVTAGIKSTDSTLTGWTKTFSKGDVFEFNIDSNDTATKAILTLEYDITGA